MSCSRYVPTCSSEMGRTYYSQTPGNISPFNGTFEDDDVPFPVFVGYVSSRQVLYTMLHPYVDVKFHHKISLFKMDLFSKVSNGSILLQNWYQLALHIHQLLGQRMPQTPTNKSPKRLASEKHDDINRFKSFKNSKDFPRIEFFKHQVPGGNPQPNGFTEVLRLANLPQVARMVFL